MRDLLKVIHNPSNQELQDFFTGISIEDKYDKNERILCISKATDENNSTVCAIVTTKYGNSNYQDTNRCSWRLL